MKNLDEFDELKKIALTIAANVSFIARARLVEDLIYNKWTVKPCGWLIGSFEWRSPRGISGSEWVSLGLYDVPDVVIMDAKTHGDIV